MVARARACVGARFRLQGRDPAIGVDCVGLAAVAFDIVAPHADYGLRGGDAVVFVAMIERAGLRKIEPDIANAGSLLMVMPGPRQLHLLVLTPTGFVHADARLRRVVEVVGRPAFPILHAWAAE